jgi:acetyltransferase-like isoleucine patch superfamily enzyme
MVGAPLFWTPEYITLGSNVLIWPGCRIEGIDGYGERQFQPHIEIQDGVSLQQHCHIVAAGPLVIGTQTTISFGVMIMDVDHEYETLDENVMTQPLSHRPTSIGRNCFIGAGAKLQAGTQLGDNCVVGSNAVVRGRYPEGCVLAGVPAKIIKRYNPARQRWQKVDSQGEFVDD